MAVKRVQNPDDGGQELSALPMCWCCCCGRGTSKDIKMLETWADLMADSSQSLRETARSLRSTAKKKTGTKQKEG